jgi:hypothetical protein
MALIKTNIGTTPDGRPLFHYHQTDPDVPVVLVGPISGSVTTSDGTTYNVTDEVIEVDSEGHAVEVAELVAQRYVDEGHPHHTDGTPFVYTKEA